MSEQQQEHTTAPETAPQTTGEAAGGSSPHSGHDFVTAAAVILGGARMRRACWPSGEFVVAQRAYPEGIEINGQTAEAIGEPPGTRQAFDHYLMRRQFLPDGSGYSWTPWTPIHGDFFARDWSYARAYLPRQAWARKDHPEEITTGDGLDADHPAHATWEGDLTPQTA